MSKVFNMVGGGGGKNVSSILITRLSSTDTITCTKDGKSYPATWDETAQHWEIVGLPLGTFTVTATNGAKTTTETVLIDIAGVYEIEMNYVLWLYEDGDPCVNVTGDWSATDKGALTTFTKNENYMTFTMNNWSGGQMAAHTLYVKTASTIDLLSYSKIILQGSSFFGQSSSAPYCRLYAGGTNKQFALAGSATTFEIEIPASEMTVNSCVGIEAYYATFNINKIWLE